jgi:outer membrane receptor protein involved in Fe transport
MGVSAAAVTAAAGPAFAQAGNVIEELVVTAQKREEALQDVPIAVSAFSQQSLEAQKIDGGPNLQTAIPNVTFSKTNFTSANFQIRGVGSKVVSGASDQGVGVHQNNAPLTANRLFEAEFYDVERVEVLRGPQGTLYGRNATGGVVNVITAKPTDIFEASIRGELGNYNTRRLRGMVNLPIVEDKMALRVAGSMIKRDGFGENLTTGNDVDDRDLWAMRATLSFNPTEGIRSWLSYEHFDEDDKRARVGKQLCVKDLGPTSVGPVPVSNPFARILLSQGCKSAHVNDPSSLGTVNGGATLAGIPSIVTGILSGDPYAGKMQNPDLRKIESFQDPQYRAKADVWMFNLELDITDNLTLTSLTSFNKDSYFTFQDYNRITPVANFNATPLTPGGFFTDPQLGRLNQLATFDISSSDTEQFSQEIRLQSNFDGPVNFNIGAIHLKLDQDTNYYVMSNGLTAAAAAGFPAPGVYIDPNSPPAGDGHNYYRSAGPYFLNATAAFGEVYWQVLDNLKITGGLRYTNDEKRVDSLPNVLLSPGRGGRPTIQRVTFKETTGRLGFDWKPDLSFTDDTLVYAFYSKGYKAGGFNPASAAGIAGIQQTFDPEFVNAYEIGLKNTLLGGSLLLNATGFYYDYQGYQISKIAARTSVNENIDAKIKGVELEAIWEPIRNLRFNGTFGYLDTEITGGSSVDTLNRTQGNPALTLINGALIGANCVAPTAQVAAVMSLINNGFPAAGVPPVNPAYLINACGGGYRTGSTAATNPLAPLGVFLDTTDGVAVSLDGKELPNAAKTTFSIGAQYTWEFGNAWEAVIRGDYYRQDDSYARIYNTVADHLPAWENVNLSLRLSNNDMGLDVEAYVKNLTDEEAITDAYLTDDSSGLFRNIFLSEPRTYGVAVTKRF